MKEIVWSLILGQFNWVLMCSASQRCLLTRQDMLVWDNRDRFNQTSQGNVRLVRSGGWVLFVGCFPLRVLIIPVKWHKSCRWRKRSTELRIFHFQSSHPTSCGTSERSGGVNISKWGTHSGDPAEQLLSTQIVSKIFQHWHVRFLWHCSEYGQTCYSTCVVSEEFTWGSAQLPLEVAGIWAWLISRATLICQNCSHPSFGALLERSRRNVTGCSVQNIHLLSDVIPVCPPM